MISSAFQNSRAISSNIAIPLAGDWQSGGKVKEIGGEQGKK